jgi:uncharacterized integral membrane protein
MKNHPRDWIAWMVAAAIIVVLTVELMSNATAKQSPRLAGEDWSTPAAVRV